MTISMTEAVLLVVLLAALIRAPLEDRKVTPRIVRVLAYLVTIAALVYVLVTRMAAR